MTAPNIRGVDVPGRECENSAIKRCLDPDCAPVPYWSFMVSSRSLLQLSGYRSLTVSFVTGFLRVYCGGVKAVSDVLTYAEPSSVRLQPTLRLSRRSVRSLRCHHISHAWVCGAGHLCSHRAACCERSSTTFSARKRLCTPRYDLSILPLCCSEHSSSYLISSEMSLM